MKTFGEICFVILVLVVSALLGGYVFMTLWDWFVVTTFKVQTLTLPQSIGLMLIVGYLKPKQKKEGKTTLDDFGKSFVEMIVMAGFAIGLGWIVTLFI